MRVWRDAEREACCGGGTGIGDLRYVARRGATPAVWQRWTRSARELASIPSSRSRYRTGVRLVTPNEEHQRREPAADDVRFVTERIGWLPFAAPSSACHTFKRSPGSELTFLSAAFTRILS